MCLVCPGLIEALVRATGLNFACGPKNAGKTSSSLKRKFLQNTIA